jgi:hypothetical protein
MESSDKLIFSVFASLALALGHRAQLSLTDLRGRDFSGLDHCRCVAMLGL